MRKITKLMLTLVALCAAVCTANAQETPTSESYQETATVQYDVPQQTGASTFALTTANQLRAERGQKIANAGKTLMISGGAVALTSTVFFAVANAQWEKSYNPDDRVDEMPVYPIFTLAGYAAGAALALVGLPIYFAGKDMVVSNGGQFISMGGNSKGVAAMIDLGIGIPNFMSLDAVYGYNFSPNLFVGGGVGGKMWLTAGLINDGGALASLPIYGQVRYTLGNKRIAPYAALSGGYDTVAGAPYVGIDCGTRIRSARSVASRYGDTVQRDSSWWIASKLAYVNEENFFLAIGVAKSF